MWRTDELDYRINEQGDRIVSFDIDSNMLPHISIDTYAMFNGDGPLDYEVESAAEFYELDTDDLEITVNTFGSILRALSERAVETLNDQCDAWTGSVADGTGGDIVEFGDVRSTYSPKFYNFATDSFKSEVTINLTRLIRWLRQQGTPIVEAVERYGNDNFSSYSGFISFVTGAMHDERRVGTLIWLGLHWYLSETLDPETCFYAVAEAEHEAYAENSTISIESCAWQRMVNEGVAEQLDGLHPESDDLTIESWRRWHDAAELAFGEDDLLSPPEAHDFREKLPRCIDAWVKSASALDIAIEGRV